MNRTNHSTLFAILLAAAACPAAGEPASAGATTAPATTAPQTTAARTTAAAPGTTVTLPSGLQYIDLKPGNGPQPAAGQKVKVHYTGRLTSGTVFDSSRQWLVPVPLAFDLGSGKVVKGMDEGVATMRVGGERRLIIPPELGYGKTGMGTDIPPNSTLIFDVELVDIKR